MLHIQTVLYRSSEFLPLFVSGFNIINRLHKINIHFLENSGEDSQSFLKMLNAEFKFSYDKNTSNAGFGSGHNLLFNKYGKDYGERFLIVNPDIIPFFDMLDKLDCFQKEFARNWGIIEIAQIPKEHPKDYAEDFKTEWAVGSAILCNREAFDLVGGFDENIFMYAEDIDLSWRIRENGYMIYFCPFAKIAHLLEGSSKKINKSDSNITFAQKNMIAMNLYLRYKYKNGEGSAEIVDAIKGLLKKEESDEILSIYERAIKRLSVEDLNIFRKYKLPKFYKDFNYANHRWS